MLKFNDLYTDEFSKLDINCPLSEYPNPQFRRDSYYSLNGKWEYQIVKDIKDLNDDYEEVIVPFPIESVASNVKRRLKKNELIVYKKKFRLDSCFIKKNTFIHFLGVDQSFYIIINGNRLNNIIPLGMPSKIDISNYVKEENEIYVVVKDNLDKVYPTGKQSKKPKGIFYTPFSGIYYPVFIESVDDGYIKNVKIDTTLDSVNLHIDSNSSMFDITIKDNGNIIHNKKYESSDILINIDNPKLWDTENPHLYDLEIKTENDIIYSYFGLREVKLVDGFIYLNGKRIFLNGILDQGYYPEGIVTPVTYDSYKFDILSMKELGFNTLRKHIKVELPYFYYLCDKYGMLVFQDFVNNGKYNFFIKTALPTIGLQVKCDKFDHMNKLGRSNFIKAGEEVIKYLHNNPCIVGYTIFNEGWGQFDSKNVYKHFKELYPSLIFDTASGWYRGAPTDLDSYHWYFKNLDKLAKVDHPVFLSEFGALCYKVEDHAYGDRFVFGYTYYPTIEDTEKAFVSLFENKIIPYKDKLVGCIYTQITDVEEEDNGLLTYDRKVFKLNKDVVKNVLAKLK